MKELVSVEDVERLFRYLAVFSPIVGILIGSFLRWLPRRITSGIIIGCIGPANYGLWKLSRAITGKLGLDSVANLLIQIGMFLAIGFAVGIYIGNLRISKYRV